jgi:hypothetical protein
MRKRVVIAAPSQNNHPRRLFGDRYDKAMRERFRMQHFHHIWWQLQDNDENDERLLRYFRALNVRRTFFLSDYAIICQGKAALHR